MPTTIAHPNMKVKTCPMDAELIPRETESTLLLQERCSRLKVGLPGSEREKEV